MSVGIHVLTTEEHKVVCEGVKLYEAAHPEDKQVVDGLKWLLLGGEVSVRYHDGGYG